MPGSKIATKLLAFALVLAVSFGAGAALGAAVGPIDVDGGDEHEVEHAPEPGQFGHDHRGGGDHG